MNDNIESNNKVMDTLRYIMLSVGLLVLCWGFNFYLIDEQYAILIVPIGKVFSILTSCLSGFFVFMAIWLFAMNAEKKEIIVVAMLFLVLTYGRFFIANNYVSWIGLDAVHRLIAMDIGEERFKKIPTETLIVYEKASLNDSVVWWK